MKYATVVEFNKTKLINYFRIFKFYQVDIKYY
jgi:hypothetical protein